MLSQSAGLKRFCVVLAAFFTVFGSIFPAWAESVRVITSAEMDFPEGQQSVQVELRASGYSVTVETSDALEPGKLLDELQAGTSDPFVAGVAVVRLGRGGIAYVWLAESNQMYRVTSSESDTARAANVLSLRVAELISLRGSGYDVERAAPIHDEAKAPPPTPKEVASPSPERRPWMLWAALGPQFGSGLRSPLASTQLGLTRDLGDLFAWEVRGHFSPGATAQRFDQGDLRVSDRGLSVSTLVQNTGSLRWQLGPTGGIRCLQLESEPNDGSSPISQDVCGFTLGAQLRAGAQWDNFSLWVSALGSLGARRIDLLADGQILATLGQPDGWIGLMTGWQF